MTISFPFIAPLYTTSTTSMRSWEVLKHPMNLVWSAVLKKVCVCVCVCTWGGGRRRGENGSFFIHSIVTTCYLPPVNLHVLTIEEENGGGDESDVKVLGVHRNTVHIHNVHVGHLGEGMLVLSQLERQMHNSSQDNLFYIGSQTLLA